MEEQTVPQRLSRVEEMFEKIVGMLHAVQPVTNFIPGVGTLVNEAAAVGDVVERAFDPAMAAAAHISISTGNASLDARLESIETMLEMASPLLKYLAHNFGFDANTVHFVAPATVVQNAVANAAAPSAQQTANAAVAAQSYDTTDEHLN
jgi:hypothetical protein